MDETLRREVATAGRRPAPVRMVAVDSVRTSFVLAAAAAGVCGGVALVGSRIADSLFNGQWLGDTSAVAVAGYAAAAGLLLGLVLGALRVVAAVRAGAPDNGTAAPAADGPADVRPGPDPVHAGPGDVLEGSMIFGLEPITALRVPLSGALERVTEIRWRGEFKAGGREFTLHGDGVPPRPGQLGDALVEVVAVDAENVEARLIGWRSHV